MQDVENLLSIHHFFLGGFGIHDFYAGYNGKGVLKIIITLIATATSFIGIGVFIAALLWIYIICQMIFVTKDAKGVPFS